MIKSDQET
ncbi:Putative translational regulatory protein BaxL [Escherichia coli]|uniref:Putative translational regulatory protein BaxL n=1 Tax=Escherichia coli (strain K12) TaxID=83333 RepID=BAXL_ECOLI|nr:putative translational regulatory protein BaxL [Escherichia coli str. K-12 substr. MG1655] [Escherichia coli]YP_010051207.1 putative translational regulatory protein BaxL [Escherichia coli str. K-12 substr. MG1655]P0DSH2.1 RecName: Full=Putative translational regulatory protein BaxL [Escherichia coli K-12]QNV50547.1 putative translational regulatory protein BaxL [Escherichia coli str. K-12 substr. MG1655]CAI4147025.1 Putative translational regulatory protein BaxL [Escherichia coli]CAI615332